LATVTVNPYRLTIQAQIQKNTSLNTLVTSCGVDINEVIANGTGTGQVDAVYAKRITIADSGTPTDLDLAGSLTDPFGDVVTFAEILLLFVRFNGSTGVLSVGGDAAAIATLTGNVNDVIGVTAGGHICLYSPTATGYAVTATTADVLQFAISTGTSVTADVIILGRSA
jgi:hypothetical protein